MYNLSGYLVRIERDEDELQHLDFGEFFILEAPNGVQSALSDSGHAAFCKKWLSFWASRRCWVKSMEEVFPNFSSDPDGFIYERNGKEYLVTVIDRVVFQASKPNSFVPVKKSKRELRKQRKTNNKTDIKKKIRQDKTGTYLYGLARYYIFEIFRSSSSDSLGLFLVLEAKRCPKGVLSEKDEKSLKDLWESFSFGHRCRVIKLEELFPDKWPYRFSYYYNDRRCEVVLKKCVELDLLHTDQRVIFAPYTLNEKVLIPISLKERTFNDRITCLNQNLGGGRLGVDGQWNHGGNK